MGNGREQDNPGQTSPDIKSAFNLHASAETRAKLGWIADRLPEWAGRDVVIVSAADFEAYDAARAGLPLTEDHFLTGYLKAAIPDSVEDLGWWQASHSDETMNMVAQKIMQSEPFAMKITPQTDSSPGVCMIALPTLENTKEFIVGAASGGEVDPDKLPGDDEDWMAFVVAHEATHCRSHLDNFNLPEDAAKNVSLSEKFRLATAHVLGNEIDADRNGIAIYRSATEAGRSLDSGVPGAFRSLRAIDSINNSGSILLGSAGHSHATNAAVALHDHERNNEKIAALRPENLQDTRGLGAALNETTMLPRLMIGLTLGPAYVLKEPNGIIELHNESPLADARTPNPSVKIEDFTTAPHRAGLLSGYALSIEKPELMYAATKALQERGAFGAGTLQEVYAQQYLDAIEKLNPNLVKPEQVSFFHDEIDKIDGGTTSLQNAVQFNIATAPEEPRMSALDAPTPGGGGVSRSKPERNPAP